MWPSFIASILLFKIPVQTNAEYEKPNPLTLIYGIPILEELLNNISIWGNMNLKM